jgi:NADH:ubiquinone oxidoreductase subunit C
MLLTKKTSKLHNSFITTNRTNFCYPTKKHNIIFFAFLINKLMKLFINYYLLKSNMLHIYLNQNVSLILVSVLFKHSINLQLNRLIDIIVSDDLYSSLNVGSFRFHLIYIFYSTVYSSKIAIKIKGSYHNSFMFIMSISDIYSSAN